MTKLDEALAGLDGDARILFLANALLDECQRQGHNIKGHSGMAEYVTIECFPDWPERFPGFPNLTVCTSYAQGAWKVEGFRTVAES